MNIIGDKIYIKILFFGTALAGKTTSLQWLFQNLVPEEMKITDRIRSIKTSFGQTLLFDFVPIQISNNIIIRIYTATGQDYYTSTRKMLFEEVDGVFFVVDSQKKELEHNREFVEEFNKYMEKIDELKKAEIIVLYNKQDVAEVYDVEYMSASLDLQQYPSYPTCAVSGMNLDRAFTAMISSLLSKIREMKGN
ncbi:MAG: GTPase domain-containing protein [Candidatus Aminicenantes bacterium]|nr:GTPase domain-containing protein [Candidatus Aminicenantes bacterium]